MAAYTRAVGERLAGPSEAGSHLTVAGQRIALDGRGEGAPGEEADPARAEADWDALAEHRAGGPQSMTGRELLLGSAFRLSAGDANAAGARLTAWGRVGMERFANAKLEEPGVGGLPLEGEVVTGVVGVDAERGRWLAGLALSASEGDGEIRPRGMAMAYDLESTMTAVNPYVRYAPTEGLSAWALAGLGRGGLTLTQRRDAADGSEGVVQTYRTDLSMTLGALGGRAALLTPSQNAGFGLALEGDAFLVRTRSDTVDVPGLGRLEAGDARASRVRLGLEGSRPLKIGGRTLTPSLEVALRHDGGDAETGAGVELGAGLAWSDPEIGINADVKARTLIAHAESGYEEWGVSGALALAPGASGRGLSLSLTPAFGADAGGTERLWNARDAAALAPAGGRAVEPAGRLDAEVGYGLPAFGGAFTGTPYAGLGWSDAARSVRLGWRLTRPTGAGAFALSVEGGRRETGDDGAPEHGVGLRLETRW